MFGPKTWKGTRKAYSSVIQIQLHWQKKKSLKYYAIMQMLKHSVFEDTHLKEASNNLRTYHYFLYYESTWVALHLLLNAGIV